eukprot:scaffold2652_cov322-Pavlova_lutheri.AAC.2
MQRAKKRGPTPRYTFLKWQVAIDRIPALVPIPARAHLNAAAKAERLPRIQTAARSPIAARLGTQGGLGVPRLRPSQTESSLAARHP